MAYLEFADEFKSKGDFIETGVELFDSEDVTNELLSIYLSISANGWFGAPGMPASIDTIGEFYRSGLWLPCVKRVALAGRLDVGNDGIPPCANLPLKSKNGFDFITAQSVEMPRGWKSFPFARHHFKIGMLYTSQLDRNDRRRSGYSRDVMEWAGWYFSLMGDVIKPMVYKNYPKGGQSAVVARYGSAALQTVSDFKHLWNIETREFPLASDISTPLRLGVSEEIVKSLFYARQAPVSESGRKRPILHWVRSHQRRLQCGIDIDIKKHLRGISEFEMDGFPFKITEPIRTEKREAA